MSENKREEGFYHVKWAGVWGIAEWTGSEWLLPGVAKSVEEHIFSEIIEQPIQKP